MPVSLANTMENSLERKLNASSVAERLNISCLPTRFQKKLFDPLRTANTVVGGDAFLIVDEEDNL